MWMDVVYIEQSCLHYIALQRGLGAIIIVQD